MRVLFWTSSFWPTIGGLEVLGTEQALELERRGHSVLVVAQHDGGVLPTHDSYGGIAIHRFPFHTALLEADTAGIGEILHAVKKLLREFRPELIHLHSLAPNALFCTMLAESTGRPLLVTRHELFSKDQAVERDSAPVRVMRSAKWIACPSQAVLEETRRVLPESRTRSSVIANGAPFPDLEPSDLPFDPPRIMCLGRLVALKGFDIAIEAFSQVLESHPRARLIVVGDGPARPELEAQVGSLGIESAVEFEGWVAPGDVYHHLNRSTIVLSPSRVGEAFCIAALQAAQLARPVIGSRLGGLPEVVTDGLTGLLVEPDSVPAVRTALERVLGNRNEAISMGLAGREFARELTIGRYTDRYEELYRTLIEESQHDGSF